MAKRFTDSNKWVDPWFCDMPALYKLVYIFILDSCDPVGVWKVNKRLAEFQIGENINWESFASYMGDRLLMIDDEKWWLTKFCDYQYGRLSEESTSKPVLYYVNLLKGHTLWIPYTKGFETLKEKEKEKDKEKEKEKDNTFEQEFEEFWGIYPKRVGKGDANKAWKKLKRPGEILVLIRKALSWQINSPQWKKDSGQYIPHPATYLNQQRWLDVAEVESRPKYTELVEGSIYD